VRTRAKNSDWAGLYGRVDACGNFSTVTTEPGPRRKQGQVLHYNQDRMLSVREFARAQVRCVGICVYMAGQGVKARGRHV
jgi:hypothetical protein